MPDPNQDQTQTTNETNETQGDDLSTLFTPEEVTAKKESLAAAQAEEERRAKLTDEERAAEDKTKADSASADAVPEAYEFKVPKGMEIDKAMLDEATPLFKEMGLSQAKAQKVVDFYAEKIIPGFVKAQSEAWTAQKESWINDVKADKEIGGNKFESMVSSAQRVLNTLGTPELKKVFDEYGLGNHPEFVRVFARMADHLKEDTIEQGGKNIKPATTTLEGKAAVLYGTTQ